MKNSKQIFDQVKKQLIEENIGGYVDLKPINNLEPTPKTDFEKKFEAFLAEDKKQDDENVKVEEKKVSKHVEEVESHNYDYKDPKNLNNQIGQEVLKGIYYEAKKAPEKSLDEIREIVGKNLAKDSQYYINNQMFGVEGLKAEEMKCEVASGKHAYSGYSDKMKEVDANRMELVKESLMMGGVVTSGNPNSLASMSGEVIKQMMAEKEEVKEEDPLPMDEVDTMEAKGKDMDGDGDIDSDDYLAARDKAIKKAMAKRLKKNLLIVN